jgi:putative nucleotidyltransferase with HDIG domain
MGLNKRTGDFDSVDLKLLAAISNQAAVFLDNHYLFEDLQDLLMGMLYALTASIDAKDPYTCGHSRRVAMISRKLAELHGLSRERVERVYLGGLLHDLGKIGIPEAVLRKPGRLTEDEFALIRRHPQIGANILGGLKQMQDVLPMVLHHHERMDGRGYPARLAGSAVPVEARIVGLADAFDAMTSCRTYRSAMPLPAVLAEIRRVAGTQLDGRCVELLLSLDLEALLAEMKAFGGADQTAIQGAVA